jgi:chloramphenicol-sensitive protein RarD
LGGWRSTTGGCPGWRSVWLECVGRAEFGRAGWTATLLLVAAGPATAIPLLFFAGAVRRIPLTYLGLLQYLTPTVQFLLAVLVFGEPMPAERLAGFILIWTALATFTAGNLSRAYHLSSRLGRRRSDGVVPA